ncbi:MAG: Glucokinase, partial [uncultured Sphingomonadaceae bacterium]
ERARRGRRRRHPCPLRARPDGGRARRGACPRSGAEGRRARQLPDR